MVWEDCPDGQKARIKWIDEDASNKGCVVDPDNRVGSCTVSEGIGYGMLITVYMDNPTNSSQSKFDKLWAYYKAYSDNGLMNGVIDGCNGVKEPGSATNADVDVALALSMAFKQWGEPKYLADAKALLGQIWSLETRGNLVWPGSTMKDAIYNPSYFAIGAMRNVFAVVDPGHDWSSVANSSLALLVKNQSSKGLNSDWCDGSGNPFPRNGSDPAKFGSDAVHTPWRVLLDYLWGGNANSKDALETINNWTMSSFPSPGKIRSAYLRDGTTSAPRTNASSLGALALPGMVRDTAKYWVQLTQSALTSNGTDPMFDLANFHDEGSWQLLYLLTVTGAFQNYWGPVKPNSVGVSGIVGGRTIPAPWALHTTARHITVSLPGAGMVELVDAKGRVLGSAKGAKQVELAKPDRQGLYFAIVRSEGQQATFPVIGD